VGAKESDAEAGNLDSVRKSQSSLDPPLGGSGVFIVKSHC